MDMFLVSIFIVIPILGFAGGRFGKTPKEFEEDEEKLSEEHLVTKLNRKRKEGWRGDFKSTIDNYNKAKEILESKKDDKSSVPDESKKDIDLLIDEAQEEFKNGGTVSLREHMKKNENKEEQK